MRETERELKRDGTSDIQIDRQILTGQDCLLEESDTDIEKERKILNNSEDTLQKKKTTCIMEK